MKRRDFLKKAGVTVAASSAFSPLVFAQNRSFHFEMVTSWPTSLDTLYGGAVNFARYFEEISGGAVTVEVYPAGAQVGGLEVYEAVSSGAFELGHTASYYYVGRDAAHSFFTAAPFGLNAQQHNAWINTGGGQELWNELNARDNLIAFTAGNTGAQMGGWFRREINTPADLNGLRMRIPGIGGQVMARAGVNVQNLPGGEIFLALDTGVIDAAEWVGPYDDEILGLNRAAPYYYGPAWQEPGAAFGAYMNLDVYNDLPETLQHAFRAASARANEQMLSEYESRNGPALERLITGGTQLRFYPGEVLAVLEGYTNEVHAENIANNDFYARVHESYTAFRERVRSWNRFGEFAFDSFIYSEASEGQD